MDKNELAMGVLEEIQQLIQDRIGGSIAPEPPKVELPAEEEAPPTSNPAMGGEELTPEESEELAAMYDSEGLGAEEVPAEEDEEDPLKKKVM